VRSRTVPTLVALLLLAPTVGALLPPEPLDAAERVWITEHVHMRVPLDDQPLATAVAWARDSAGAPAAVIKVGSQSVFAHRTIGGWEKEPIPGLEDTWSHSLAIDSQGRPHVSAQTFWTSDLLYAVRNVAGVWETTAVMSEGFVGWYTVIQLDAEDRPHIMHSEPGANKLWYSRHDGQTWQHEVVINEDGPESYFSFALTSTAEPRVAACRFVPDPSSCSLWYFERTPTANWTYQLADQGGGVSPSLALDALDQPHVSYRGKERVLKYATRIAGTWSAEVADAVGINTGFRSSIAVDSGGRPHIANDMINGFGGGETAPEQNKVVYVTKLADGSWSREYVDLEGRQARPKLFLDDSNCPHVAYEIVSDQIIKLGRGGDIRYARPLCGVSPGMQP
jgi:hypothetical protein